MGAAATDLLLQLPPRANCQIHRQQQLAKVLTTPSAAASCPTPAAAPAAAATPAAHHTHKHARTFVAL